MRSVCRVKAYDNGFFVEYPNPSYAEYFRSIVIKKCGGILDVSVEEPRETDNQAFMRMFHAIRDSFARYWNEPKSKVEADLIREFGVKEGLKKRLKTDYGSQADGELKSLRGYSRGEWIVLIRGALTEAMEQGIESAAIAIEFGGRAAR